MEHEPQPTTVADQSTIDASVGGPLTRLSPLTQQVLSAASEQARQLGHAEIRPEHILVALLLDQRAVVSRPMLRVVGTTREQLAALRETLLERLRVIPPSDGGDLRLSDGCKQVLQAALEDSVRLLPTRKSGVDPIHLLVGLISEGSAILGTPLATSLALRGLRVAVGTGAWGIRGVKASTMVAGALADPVALGFRSAVTPAETADPPLGGQPAATQNATRDNVITLRVSDADLAAVDTLVEVGAMRTRSEASAWLMQSGIAANQPFFEQIRAMHEEIGRLRQEVRRLADEYVGRRDSGAGATA